MGFWGRVKRALSRTPLHEIGDDRPGGQDWRDKTEILFRYLRRDMSDVKEHFKQLYPKTWREKMVERRTLPYVWRLAREKAKLYTWPPERRYERVDSRGQRTGEEVGEAARDTIRRITIGANLDAHMRDASQQLVALNNACILVFPVSRVSGVRYLVVPPHRHWVQLDDPQSSDVDDVAIWWVELPVAQDTDTGIMQWGLARITPEEAYWEDGPQSLVGEPIWFGQRRNPIGRIPVAMLRGLPPQPGDWWASLPDDLLDTQRALIHDYTDMGHIARNQGYGQPVFRGLSKDTAEQMDTGPEASIGLPDPDADFKYAQPQADLSGYQTQLEAYQRAVVSAEGLNAQTFLKSSGVTAQAKRLEMIDRDEERQALTTELQRAEQRVYDLTRAWVNVQRSGSVDGGPIPRARVHVEYRVPRPPSDPLHEAQANELEIGLGIDSPERIVAERRGVSRAEARQIVEDNRQAPAPPSQSEDGEQ